MLFRHWLMYWPGREQVTSQYLNQCQTKCITTYGVTIRQCCENITRHERPGPMQGPYPNQPCANSLAGVSRSVVLRSDGNCIDPRRRDRYWINRRRNTSTVQTYSTLRPTEIYQLRWCTGWKYLGNWLHYFSVRFRSIYMQARRPQL